MDPESHDTRSEELETLLAIYPEIQQPEPELKPFTFELELPVEPAKPIVVTFPAPAPAVLPVAASASGSVPASVVPGPEAATLIGSASAAAVQPPRNGLPELDALEVSHLPPLCLRISLPDGYPLDKPPTIHLSTTPPWLSASTISRLEDDGVRLWDESGRDMVGFTYIDHIQRAAEDVFGTIGSDGTLQVDPEHKLAVLDYDIKAKKAAFEKETFDCGVCLDPKKGSKCHKMLDCGHVFCLQCLIDFYNDAITAGTVDTVRCLAPNCAKERAEAHAQDGVKQTRKPKTFISPSELLQIGLTEETVKRYVNLKYKIELEADKNTIYCPRQWCNGAARSKNHKKPDGLEFTEVFEDQQGGPETSTETADKKPEKFDPADLLCVCEDCGLAFCSRCYQSWHGEFFRCYPKRTADELTAEEKASLEYIKLYTSPCPTCSAPAQKTFGCNHMCCSRCDTHFCYLCSSWLDPRNPYQHYNEQPGGKVTQCYMRLWELEGEEENLVPQRVNRPVQQPLPVEVHPIPEIEEPDDSDSEPDEDHRHQPLHEGGQNIAVAREAPLVLRLVDDQAAPRQHRQPIPPPAPEAPPVQGGRGRNAPHRGANRGHAAARGGAGAGAAPRGARLARGGRGGRGRVAPDVAQLRQNGRQQFRPNANNANNQGDQVAGELDAAQQAWVRHFVQLALIDAEDEMEGNSDDEDEVGWRIR